MMDTSSRNLSVYSLTALVVGSMIGAGIFSLPRTFGMATGPFGAIIAWLVAGIGMYTLARVFQGLAERRPDLDAGVYAYAKAGFGEYAGFLSAFGYWIGSCIGNVSYWVLVKSTLGAYFPIFGEGNTLVAILSASIGIWLFHFMILKGIQQAAFINTVVTIAKVVPIIGFLVCMVFAFSLDQFRENFWGGSQMASTSLLEQVRATMLITVFVFLGIEGASVYSRYARKRSDIGRATLLGFAFVTGLMVMVTLLPYAALPRAEIASLRQPSMSALLDMVLGTWGSLFISIGLLVSVLGAYLAWQLICAEVLFAAARTNDMPRVFATENDSQVPSAALWITNLVVQVFVISTYWSKDAFSLMLNLTSSTTLIPYILVAGYGVKVALQDKAPAPSARTLEADLVFAILATIYTFFMIVAGGVTYLMLSAVLYAPGTLLYLWARKERELRVFKTHELVVFVVVALLAIGGVYGLVTGGIEI